MAEPGDPHTPDDDDDLIGFATPASLQGRTRVPDAKPAPPVDEPEPDLFDERPNAAPSPRMVAGESDATIAVRPRPIEAGSIFEPSPGFRDRPRRSEPKNIGGGMNLYAVYALILFAVPTFGVSAVIGLLAVTGRDGPEDPAAQSHFIYQQRTLWTAAVAAAAGFILLAAPLPFGVPLLFAAALWTLARGAAGVWALKSGRPIADPRGWWIRQ